MHLGSWGSNQPCCQLGLASLVLSKYVSCLGVVTGHIDYCELELAGIFLLTHSTL